jgi:hypothetical protein
MSTATGQQTGRTSIVSHRRWWHVRDRLERMARQRAVAIDGCGEVDIVTRRSDGTLRAARTVRIVRHGSAMYVRSVNGTTAAWYRGARTCHEGELSAARFHRGVVFVEASTHVGEGSGLDGALDGADRGKYGRSSGAVARITADVARATTLRVEPAWPFTADHLNDEKDMAWTRTPAAPR